MVDGIGARHSPPPRSVGDHGGTGPENQSIRELVSALKTASRAEEIGRIEAALAAREAKLSREIEKQRNEKELLEETHELDRLEKLRAEDELRQAAAIGKRKADMVLVEVKEEEDEGLEVISELEKNQSKKLKKGSSAPGKGKKSLQISGYRRVVKQQIDRGRKKKLKGRPEDYVQYRCSIMSFFHLMQRLKKHLTQGQLKLLQKTPFWPLISACYSGVISEDQCKKSEPDVLKIIRCFNPRTMRFEFGRVSAKLTAEDISEILGLPLEGESVNLKYSRKYKSDFIKRYFLVKRVTKKRVDEALDEALKGKRETDVEDVVRLILIELCLTFLLCNSANTTSWNLVKHCEEFEKLSRYSWANAVADFLHASLRKQNRHKPYSVGGCVVVIMLWLCEKTTLVKPIKGREGHTPALVKWNFKKLHWKLKNLDVADIGLSFKKDNAKNIITVEANGQPDKQAESGGRDDEDTENENDDTVGSLEDDENEFYNRMGSWEDVQNEADETVGSPEDRLIEVYDSVGSAEDEPQPQMPKPKFCPTLSKRSKNENEGQEKRSEDLWETVQNTSAEVAKAQAKVKRLTAKLESKKEKIKKLKRKVKNKKKEKRRLKEDNELLMVERKSVFGSWKRLVKKLEGKVKNLEKENMELIKENQALKDPLNQGSRCATAQSREDIQMEVHRKQSHLTGVEESVAKRALDPELEHEQGCKKKRKVEEEKEDAQSNEVIFIHEVRP